MEIFDSSYMHGLLGFPNDQILPSHSPPGSNHCKLDFDPKPSKLLGKFSPHHWHALRQSVGPIIKIDAKRTSITFPKSRNEGQQKNYRK